MSYSRTFALPLTAIILSLSACGQSDGLADMPLTELTEAAANGDPSAMQELERRAASAVADADAQTASDGDPETAFNTAYYSGDLDTVASLAEAGNVFAITYEANMVQMLGSSTEAEKAKARSDLEAAAAGGHAHAMYLISEDYLDTKALYPVDEAKAFEIGEQAAEAGYMEAMFRTGVRYQYGHVGAPQDDEKAVKWLTKAKEAGHRQAQQQLDELAAK